MQEKPSRNDERLYDFIPYHNDNGKISAGERKKMARAPQQGTSVRDNDRC